MLRPGGALWIAEVRSRFEDGGAGGASCVATFLQGTFLAPAPGRWLQLQQPRRIVTVFPLVHVTVCESARKPGAPFTAGWRD